jgi:TonB family protein
MTFLSTRPLITCIAVTIVVVTVSGQTGQLSPRQESTESPFHVQGRPVYRVGGDVTAPHATYAPDPEYSEEARIAKLQGTCALSVVIGANGKPSDIRISHSLGMGLDEKSIEAVRRWQFEPGMKNGQPVAVLVTVETTFRTYPVRGLPATLKALPQDGPVSLPASNKRAAHYPLIVDISFVTSKKAAAGFVISAEATFSAGVQPTRATVSCNQKRNCLMLNWGKYQARLTANVMELTGPRDGDGKWQKARFFVTPFP